MEILPPTLLRHSLLFAGLPQPLPRLQRQPAGSADAGGGEEQGHPRRGLPRYHGEGWFAP